MLTNQIDPNTFSVGGKTYTTGDVIELLHEEQEALNKFAEISKELDDTRARIFDRLHSMTVNADASMAAWFFEYETARLDAQYQLSKLIRQLCLRLGGLLPLQPTEDKDGKPQLAIQSLAGTNRTVVLTTEGIRSATGFNHAVGDLRLLGAFLTESDLNQGVKNVETRPKDWPKMGCPHAWVNNSPLNADYAKELTEFKWADHEGQNLDQKISEALAHLLSSPGRFQAMQNNTQPLSFIAGLVHPYGVSLCNLSAAAKGTDQFRIEVLQHRIENSGVTDALFLIQFGPLRKEGSTHDFNADIPANQPIMGVSFALVIRTNSGPIIGSKSWTFVKEANGEPSMRVFGLFENSAGLVNDAATDILKGLLSESIHV